jgi:hypothetical protein
MSQRERFTIENIINMIKLVDSAKVYKGKKAANTSTIIVMAAVARSGV